MSTENANSTFNKLMGKPDIEEAQKQYEAMSNAIREALTAKLPQLGTWGEYGELSGATCGRSYPELDMDGQVRSLPHAKANSSIPDDKWDEALAAVGDTAERYGFDSKPQRLHDANGSHYVAFHNYDDEGEVLFNTDRGATVLSVKTGCYLTAKAKKRGHPLASE